MIKTESGCRIHYEEKVGYTKTRSNCLKTKENRRKTPPYSSPLCLHRKWVFTQRTPTYSKGTPEHRRKCSHQSELYSLSTLRMWVCWEAVGPHRPRISINVTYSVKHGTSLGVGLFVPWPGRLSVGVCSPHVTPRVTDGFQSSGSNKQSLTTE